jgi:spore germination protein GerM
VAIATLLLAGALLRPVVGMVPEPIAVAPQYARPAVTLYHVLEEPGYLAPVAHRVGQGEPSARAAVDALLAGPMAGPDLVPAFASDTSLIRFERSGERATVALSPGALDGVDAGRAIDALVLTLTEFAEVETVSVSVGGRAVDADGIPVDGPVLLARPAPNPETPDAAAGGTELYFAYPGHDRYLVPVTRATAPDGREPGAAMDAFLAGPLEGSGLEPVLPADVSIRSTRVEDGLATVDFDAHLVYAYRLSKANAMFVRRAVMATLTGLPNIDAGLIEIDGSRLLLYTCVNVTQEFPQARPWAINDEFYLTALDRDAAA